MNLQITSLCHFLIESNISEPKLCIDATAGNGNDTAFLCRLSSADGKVIAFDIQKEALDNTRNRLISEGLIDKADLILDTHCNMHNYAEYESVDCIVFNLGYLPGGDHSLATKPDTSVNAIETGLKLLRHKGIMSLCIYSGGDSGFEERDAVLSFIKSLDSRYYTVLKLDYFNRPNNPPIPVIIIKK